MDKKLPSRFSFAKKEDKAEESSEQNDLGALDTHHRSKSDKKHKKDKKDKKHKKDKKDKKRHASSSDEESAVEKKKEKKRKRSRSRSESAGETREDVIRKMMKTQEAKTEREVPKEEADSTHNRWNGLPYSSNYYALREKRMELPAW